MLDARSSIVCFHFLNIRKINHLVCISRHYIINYYIIEYYIIIFIIIFCGRDKAVLYLLVSLACDDVGDLLVVAPEHLHPLEEQLSLGIAP